MHKYRYRLAAAALLLLSGVSAQACEIWRDKELGIWRGNCKLKDFLVSQTFIGTYQPRLILRWPDLHIRRFKYFVTGSSIEIEADVENIGMGNAPASTLVVDADFGDPLTGVQQGTMQFTVQVPALPLNTSQRVNVGTMLRAEYSSGLGPGAHGSHRSADDGATGPRRDHGIGRDQQRPRPTRAAGTARLPTPPSGPATEGALRCLVIC